MVTVIFKPESDYAESEAVWQWDYGQVLEIHGLCLPAAAEIHFGIERGNSTVTRVGTSSNGVTVVDIPDALLQQSRNLIVYLFAAGKGSGKTERWIRIPVRPRPKPDGWKDPSELLPQKPGGCITVPHCPSHRPPHHHGGCHEHDDNPFRPVIESVTVLAERAELAEKASSEHAEDAEKYAEQAENRLAEISGEVSAGKEEIDEYCRQKESELRGDTGNVYFASFSVVNGRLKMYSDPTVDKVCFRRKGSRLSYRLNI